MLTCNAFVTGSIFKNLDDDIICGSQACAKCPSTIRYLEAQPTSYSHLCQKDHYIVPDKNVIIHQFDVLGESAFKNVIILQTVLEELRHRHSPAYNRVREVLSNADRHYYAFMNEHHRYTYTERKPGESCNDRNDRAIRNAVKWYREHLKLSAGCDIDVVLLTNDKENSKKAEEEGLTAYTFAEYVKCMTQFPSLIDRLSNVNMNTTNDGHELVDRMRELIYPEYWENSKIQDCLRDGSLKQGTFRIRAENYTEGFVFMGEIYDESDSKAVFIQAILHQNRAIDGDTVAVEILPEDQWTCPSSLVLEDKTKTPDVEKDENEVLKLLTG